MNKAIKCLFLGQSGIWLNFNSLDILIDPYIFNSVCDKYGFVFDRQVQFPHVAVSLAKADYIFLTHDHLDHADPESIGHIYNLNPKIQIFCPEKTWKILKKIRVPNKSFHVLQEKSVYLNQSLKLNVIPAAHTKLKYNRSGNLPNVGYLFEYHKQFIYHSGDTIPHPEIISAVTSIGKPDIAFLPCNERNYYREMMGIVGNMSVREMFQFAEDIKAKRVCPIHWDMFKFNSVFPEEIKLLHSLLKSSVNLTIPEHGVYYDI